MSSRVTGAGLALIAVALLAVSIATPAVLPAQLSLFAGHPTVAEHTRGIQDAYVGFFSAQLCNSGGDGTCRYGDASAGFRVLAYAELGVTAVLIATSVLLALLTLRKSERRKTVAGVVWTVGALALIGAGAMILYGPFREASVPIGIGMAVHGAGIVGTAIAGLIAVRPPPPIRLRVADRSSYPAGLPTAQAFDRRSLSAGGGDPDRRSLSAAGEIDRRSLSAAGEIDRRGRVDDRSRPGDLGSEPDPFAPNAHDRSPFAGPQLRPLYDAAPIQGGTGGFLPIDRPPMPTRPPTPLSRSQISAVAGIPTPPPFPAEEPRAMASPVPAGSLASSPALFDDDDHRLAAPLVEPRTMRFPEEPHMPPNAEQRPMPPPPFARNKPPSVAPPPHPAAAPPAGQTTYPGAGVPLGAPPMYPGAAPAGLAPPHPGAAPSGLQLPYPAVAAPAPLPPAAGHAGAKPRTQVSLVPPMPDNDLPIAPPTAQIAAELGPTASAGAESTQFPRPETPLAPPPLPVAPRARAGRDSQLPPPIDPTRDPGPTGKAVAAPTPRDLPPPIRGAQAPRPLRASVPMPVRPGGSVARPTRPQPPDALRSASPRPTIPTTVPPIPAIPAAPAIPAIPAIPPLPAAIRAQTDTTDPEGHSVVTTDPDQATISRVPIEVGDFPSNTHVSVEVPSPEELDAAVERAGDGDVRGERLDDAIGGAHGPATLREPYIVEPSPGGQPVVANRSGEAAAAVSAAARPTIQVAEQRASIVPTIIGPPISPQLRDRPAPKLPISTAPESLPPPRDNKQAAGPSPACPQCESPMAWVEEHLRFYCKSCRMYF